MPKSLIEIRNMFVSAVPGYGRQKCSTFDIAILTPSDGYVEYELRFCYDRMTRVAYDTIKSLLADYRFTEKSEICMTENVSQNNPLSMYLSVISQQMNFKICRVSVKKMSDRLCGIIGGIKSRITHDKNLDKPHMETIWKYLVKSKGCAWITPAYAEYVATLNSQQRRRKKLVRIGAYYMRKRRLKYLYTVKSKLRAAEA